MGYCGGTCRKWAVYILSAVLLILGILTVVFWGAIFNVILKKELSLEGKGSAGFNIWKETPIPMYIEFYLYNWTNAAQVLKDWQHVKPHFDECGPYTFSEHHVRVNVSWNDNNTLTYYQKRIWKFVPEKSNGSLSDKITNLNVIAATVAYLVRKKHYLVRRGVNFFIEEKEKSLVITRNVSELLFEGYEDELLHLAKDLNLTGFNIPFERFGWFYGRNESVTYDGLWNIYTGTDDINKLGLITRWNGSPKTSVYEGQCDLVNDSSSGELFPPVKNYKQVTLFTPDLCSIIKLDHVGGFTLHGIDGMKFAANDFNFDNGTKYPEQSCFSVGEVMPSGVRNASACRFGAPAFVSYPHFYLADPIYRTNISGMKPDKDKHETVMALEPNTGIPLSIRAQMQVNILIETIHGINLFEHTPHTLIPMLWFRQTALLTDDFADLTKMLIVLPTAGTYTGYGIIAIAVVLFVCAVFVTWHKGWKGSEGRHLLSQQSL